MQHHYDTDYFFNQIYTIKKWALNAAAIYLLAFLVMDFYRYDGLSANQAINLRLLYMVLPFSLVLLAFYGQHKFSIKRKPLQYLTCLVIIMIGFGHAEMIELAANQSKFFPRIGLTIILIYAGILLVLPLSLSIISSLLIIGFAVNAYQNTGMATTEIMSLSFFYLVFSSCCVLMNYICAKVLLTNFNLVKVIDHQANTDELTQLSNRRYFYQQSFQVYQQSIREKQAISLLLIDLDDFKLVNDLLGHNHGDQVLQGVANILKHHCRRPLDLVARWGGDEFVMLLYDCDEDHLDETCTQIINEVGQMRQKLMMKNPQAKLGVSIGLAMNTPNESIHINSLMEVADKALYQVKKSGKNNFKHHDISQYQKVGNSNGGLRPV